MKIRSRKILIVLFSMSLIAANSSLFSYSQKTYLATRPVLYNLAMETPTWHYHALNYGQKEHNSHVAVTTFYQNSDNSEEVGRYFGLEGRNYFTIGREATDDVHPTNNLKLGDQNVKGKVSFNPKQEVFGARIDYFQNFNIPFKKLFIKASMPIIFVENDLNVRFVDETEAVANQGKIEQFFSGQTVGNYTLNYAILENNRKAAGVADIDLALGYKWFDSENRHLFFAGVITIPTGNRPKGKYIFEPIYGNGNHFGVGFNIDAALRLWNREKHSARLLLAVNHRYLFEGTEKRTIGFDRPGYNFNHYSSDDDKIAANDSTINISNRPGNLIDAMANFAFTSSKFILDVGYNLFYKQVESVSKKEDILFTSEGLRDNIADYENVSSTTTPSILTHKIVGGIGYTFTIYDKYPLSLNLGGSYEFASCDHELKNYAFWLKSVVSF